MKLYIIKNFPRTILPDIERSVESEQIVVLTGARQTGKTTLTETQLPEKLNASCSYVSFDDPDERSRFERNAVSLLESFSSRVVVLDEVQKLPALFDPLAGRVVLYIPGQCTKHECLTIWQNGHQPPRQSQNCISIVLPPVWRNHNG